MMQRKPTVAMTNSLPLKSTLHRKFLGGAIVIAALAMLMAWPALKGGFVGGDDQRLVLNHVLVNQPSLAHAIELFSIVHRDLYQPLPLLTFQFEFVIANALGFFDKGVDSGAWLFHFDNIWLHALNTLLVAAVLLKLQQHDRAIAGAPIKADPLIPAQIDAASAARAIAFVAAIFFAIHPLQVEVVSWINGRMLLLSTLFLLLSALAFARFLDRGGAGMAILCLFLLVLSAVSKIRVGAPAILAIMALARGHGLGRRFWAVIIPAGAITGIFLLVNVWSTSEAAIFTDAAQRLQGPRLVRVFLALGFYIEHFVWPAGLASFYPTATEVSWSDPESVRATVIVLLSLALMGLLALKSRAARWGMLWFFAGIFDTLPFVPARNILAADRYMYLPIIGLLWTIVTAGYAGYARLRLSGATWPKPTAILTGAILVPLLVFGICRPLADSYTTPLKKTLRVAELYPKDRRVWELVGWVYHRAEDYDRAIQAGERELANGHADVRSSAYELIGISYFEKGTRLKALDPSTGDQEQKLGMQYLAQAMEADPRSGSAKYRMAVAFEEIGELDKAVELLEEAADLSRGNDPVIRRLAAVYRKQGRLEDARSRYEHVLGNNPYDVEAIIGLVELDIDAGTDASLAAAEQRLLRILADVRSDPRLQQNLLAVRSLQQAGGEMRLAAATFISLTDGRYPLAVDRAEKLLEAGDGSREARAWLLQSLERFDAERPGIPWTYGLTARLLIADDQLEAARAFLDHFGRTCKAESCGPYAVALKRHLALRE